MANIEIIVGSMLGASEYVADALALKLQEFNHSSTIHLTPDLNEINPENYWLICTSTHGAGDLPDNIEPFAKNLKQQNLSNIKFAVIGLGDSSYDTFCFGAKQLQNIMQEQGATMIREAIHIDVLEYPIPEDIAVEWLDKWLNEKPDLA